jgi:hypothetical protein
VGRVAAEGFDACEVTVSRRFRVNEEAGAHAAP